MAGHGHFLSVVAFELNAHGFDLLTSFVTYSFNRLLRAVTFSIYSAPINKKKDKNIVNNIIINIVVNNDSASAFDVVAVGNYRQIFGNGLQREQQKKESVLIH